jgi:cysteine desulfurase
MGAVDDSALRALIEGIRSGEVTADEAVARLTHPHIIQVYEIGELNNLPFFSLEYANPSSPHLMGRKAGQFIDKARGQVAVSIGCDPSEVIFTSGATESNNVAIFGIIAGSNSYRKRIVTTPIEHKSVLEPFKQLGKMGYDVVFLPIDSTGLVDLNAVDEIITDDPEALIAFLATL